MAAVSRTWAGSGAWWLVGLLGIAGCAKCAPSTPVPAPPEVVPTVAPSCPPGVEVLPSCTSAELSSGIGRWFVEAGLETERKTWTGAAYTPAHTCAAKALAACEAKIRPEFQRVEASQRTARGEDYRRLSELVALPGGDLSAAADLRGLAFAVDPADLRHLEWQATLQLWSGRPAEAQANFRKLEAEATTRKDPLERLVAQEQLGRGLLVDGKVDEAIPLLERATQALETLQLPPGGRYTGRAYEALAEAYALAGRHEDRATQLVKGAEFEAWDGTAQYDAAVALFVVGDLRGARTYLERAKTLKPKPRLDALEDRLHKAEESKPPPDALAHTAALLLADYPGADRRAALACARLAARLADTPEHRDLVKRLEQPPAAAP